MDPPETAPITVNSEEVEEAIKSFRPGSAPGPSGLRGKHLEEVGFQGNGRGAAALAALTRLVNPLAGGKLPAEAAPYFCGANLCSKDIDWTLPPCQPNLGVKGGLRFSNRKGGGETEIGKVL